MLVAIHQPNFFPWLGYFDKIAQADRFVILDTVPLWRSGSHYFNRVQILINNQPSWLTMPLRRSKDDRAKIETARIAEDGKWRRKAVRTLQQNYRRAAFFQETMGFVEKCFDHDTDRLCEFNLNVISQLCERLELGRDKLVRSRDLLVDGQSNELLIGLVHAAGGDRYISGGGATYQEDDMFSHAGIKVVPQNFDHPNYVQVRDTEFIPGLSIIDALMNCGFAGTAKLIGR